MTVSLLLPLSTSPSLSPSPLSHPLLRRSLFSLLCNSLSCSSSTQPSIVPFALNLFNSGLRDDDLEVGEGEEDEGVGVGVGVGEGEGRGRER